MLPTLIFIMALFYATFPISLRSHSLNIAKQCREVYRCGIAYIFIFIRAYKILVYRGRIIGFHFRVSTSCTYSHTLPMSLFDVFSNFETGKKNNIEIYFCKIVNICIRQIFNIVTV